MSKTTFSGSKNPKAPDSAFSFQVTDAAFQFAAKEDNKPRGFALQLYDGGVSQHWYWGKLAFDLQGIELEKKKIPMLFAHDTDKRIGVATEASFDGAFKLKGYALDNETSRSIQEDADQGFPFEASLKFDPNKSKFRFVRDGEKAEVNGKTIVGPGTIFTKTVVKEGSVCVFGALNNCKTEAFAERPEELERIEPMKIEELKQQHPELYQQVFDAGVEDGRKQTRQQFKEVAEACGDYHDLAVQAFSENKSAAEALKLRCDKQASELKARDEKIAELQKKAAEGAEASGGRAADEQEEVETAESEFSDDVLKNKSAGKVPGKKGGPDFSAMTETQLKEHYEKTAELQDEFLEVGDFVAFVKAQKAGKVDIFENKK